MDFKNWRMQMAMAGLLLLFLGILAWPALQYPLGSDQGTFAYGASILLNGGMLYRDAADTKPPGIFLLYALAETIFGSAESGYRRLEPFILFLGLFPLLQIFQKMKWPLIFLAMSALAAWYYAGLSYWDLGQAELPAKVLTLAYIAWILRRAPGPLHLDTIGGILPGLLVLLKQHFVLLALVFVYTVVLDERRVHGTWKKSFVRAMPRLAAHGAGMLIPFLLILVWFAARGSAGDLLQGMFVWPFLYARHAGLPAESLMHYSFSFLFHLPLVAVLAFGFMQLWRQRRERQQGILLAALAVILLCSVLQRKFWTYHLVFLLPGLVILLGAAAQGMLSTGNARIRAVLLSVLLIADVAFTSFNFAHRREREEAPGNHYLGAWSLAIQLSSGRISRETYLDSFAARLHPRDGRAPLHRPGADWRVAQMVGRHCRPGESLQLLEFRPAVYVLAQRRSSHRFFFWSLPSLLGRQGKKLEEEMKRLTFVEKRPDCIVFGSGAHWDSPQARELDPGHFGFVKSDSILEDAEAGVRMDLFRSSP